MITIIDYGMGNLGSIVNMLKKLGATSHISSEPGEIARAEKLILPGVGAFDQGMTSLVQRGLVDVLHESVLEKRTPILGLCLGTQLFTERSEEGRLPGLGWLEAETVRFRLEGNAEGLKVPHMGWNYIELRESCPLLRNLPQSPRFYFVHSYHLRCRQSPDTRATTEYGYDFPSVVQRDNIMGAQFHPEKSHKYGISLLRNFVEHVR